MMQFPKEKIQAAFDDVKEFTEGEIVFNERDILVIAESSQIINEFETRLAARSVEWDCESVDGSVLLRILTDVQGNRTDFHKRYNDEWQARYTIVAA